jgi:hypothetical protein
LEEATSLFQGRVVYLKYGDNEAGRTEFEVRTHCRKVVAFYPAGLTEGGYREHDLIKIITDPGGTRVVAVKDVYL